MRSARLATTVAVLGALAIPVITATAADAAPASTSFAASRPCDRPGPWVIDTKAVAIRSKASPKSAALGVLYKSHKFTVHKATKSGSWVHITDKTTGVKGWVSATYVHRQVYMCLD
ncbi:SH3 domain-containing protein [Streptomyces sp. NPDC093589]|uniref:SH3 domain-containing protein n=1 Tax=Streptomyces sp. NPDC093589 TaxID=3366043 RepID=UPI00381AD478